MTYFQEQAMDVESMAATETDQKAAMRSCTTCSKAKAKCVRRPGQEICERCARLRKECQSREPVLRRRKVVKTTRAAQLEKLEHKIEHLVNALSTKQGQRGYSVDMGHLSPPTSHLSDHSRWSETKLKDDVLNTICEGPPEYADPPVSVPSTSPSSSSLYTPTSQITSPGSVSPDYQSLGVTISEAEILLNRFVRLMAPTFPFVVLPLHTTARELLTTKPLLLHAIVTVTYFHDLPKQQIMLKQLMRDISERVLINGEKSVDILQGLLILVAWYHPHVFSQQQTTNLLHLAQALTTDLQIDRPGMQCDNIKHIKTGSNPPPPPKQPTMEEFRALAGTYYMSAMFATSFKRIEAMRFTKYLEDALTALQQTHEYDSDLFLVQMVRIQHLIDDATKADNPTAPMQMYVKAFTVDLDRLRMTDPCKDTSNMFLRMQYLAAEIVIWEMSLNDLQENNAKPLRSHLDDLCQCVKAIKSFIDVFFTMPPSLFLTLPFYFFGQFGHSFIALIRLASLEVDGWDMKDLHEEFNFSEVIEETARRYEEASKSAPDGLVLNNDSFAKWAVRVRWMKTVYESKLAQDDGTAEDKAESTIAKPSAPYDAATPAQQQPTPPDDVLSGDFFNYLDENFWQSFAGDFELGFPEMAMTQ